jgi:hypothetical protein
MRIRSVASMLVRERAQTLDDILPLDAATVGVLAESTRYQGEWNGNDIYLAVGTDGTACVLSIPIDDPDAWSAVSLTHEVRILS